MTDFPLITKINIVTGEYRKKVQHLTHIKMTIFRRLQSKYDDH